MFGFFGNKNKEVQHNEEARITRQPMQNEPRPSSHHMVPELETFKKTVVGSREYQQDECYVSPSKVLAANKVTRVMAIVCDGMGGMADGEKASRTACEMMKAGFQKIEKAKEVNIQEFFRSGIKAIDNVIYQFPKENGRGSGTTMVACIVENNMLYCASVGDSRIYLISGGKITQVTRDHNYKMKLDEMVRAGQMTPEEAASKKQKEALISFLGIGNVSLMDITQPIELKLGDVVMLCSDGVTKILSDEQIRKIIATEKIKPEEKAEKLIEKTILAHAKSQDNTTVALIHYHEKEIKRYNS